MLDELLLEAEEKMEKAILSFNRELATLRTGRANPAMLDRVMIDYYGSLTPINQVASVSVPEARQLMIKPYDGSTLKEIEKAIGAADLGLTPQNDGTLIRINIPALTEDRRRDMVKMIGKMAEEAKVALRNVRRDVNEMIKKSDASEDDKKGYSEDVQTLTDNFVKKIDALGKDKEVDILAI